MIAALAAWTVQGQPLPGSFQTAPGSLAELSVHHLSSTLSTTTTIDSFDNNMELQDSALGLQFHLHNGCQNSLEPDEHIADGELATKFGNKKEANLEEMARQLAKYITNLREITQKLSTKDFRELEVIKANFPQILDIDAGQVELGHSEPDINAGQVELGHSEPDIDASQVQLGQSELDIDACQVELGNSKLDTGNFDQLTLKEPLGSRQPQKRQLRRQQLEEENLEDKSLDKALGLRSLQLERHLASAAWQKRPSERQLPRKQLGRRKRPSDRQLLRQQLGRRDLQKGNFRDSSLEEETFSKAASTTAAWKTRPSAKQLQRKQLGKGILP